MQVEGRSQRPGEVRGSEEAQRAGLLVEGSSVAPLCGLAVGVVFRRSCLLSDKPF